MIATARPAALRALACRTLLAAAAAAPAAAPAAAQDPLTPQDPLGGGVVGSPF